MTTKTNGRHPALRTIAVEHRGRTYRVNIRPKSTTSTTLILDVYLSTGERRRLSAGTTDVAKAVRKAETLDFDEMERTAAVDTPAAFTPPPSHNPRFRDLHDYYIVTHLPNKGSRQSSIEDADATLREFELWLKDNRLARVNDITPLVIERWKQWLRVNRGNSARTICKKINALRACFNAAAGVDLIAEVPIKKWLTPEFEEEEIDPIQTPEELAQVLAAVEKHQPKIYNIMCWIAGTGNRPSDARSLKRKQVNIASGIVHRAQVKTGALATYPIGPLAMAALLRELERNRPGPDGEIFTRADGSLFGKQQLYRLFKAALKSAGIEKDYNVKTLRHTFGYQLVNIAGCPLPMVQQCMGHSDIKMTMKYVRPGDARPYLETISNLLKIPKTTGTAGTRKKNTRKH